MLEEETAIESPRTEEAVAATTSQPPDVATESAQPFPVEEDVSRKVLPPAVRPRWVPDAEEPACYCCQTPFSFLLRRHHCRGCGHIFCHPCTDWWLLPPAELEYDTVQRLCETCFSRLSSVEYSRTYDAWGNPEDPAIVMIHGASGTRRNWALLGPALAQRGYYAISLDMPGHASRYREKLTMDSAMEAIAEAVNNLVPSKRAFVMGGSMGGYIAMTFGARHLDMCRGLIIGQTGTDMKNSRTMLNWMTRYYKLVSRKTKATLVKQFHKSYPLYAQVEDEAMNELFLRTGVFLDCWPDIVEMMAGEDYDEHMKSVGDLPVLFFNGEIDFREAEMKWLNAAKNGRLEIIKEAGHMCVVDTRYRDEVKELLVDFMDEVLAKHAQEEDKEDGDRMHQHHDTNEKKEKEKEEEENGESEDPADI